MQNKPKRNAEGNAIRSFFHKTRLPDDGRLALSSMLRVKTPVGSYVPIPRIALGPAALSVPEAQYISPATMLRLVSLTPQLGESLVPRNRNLASTEVVSGSLPIEGSTCT